MNEQRQPISFQDIINLHNYLIHIPNPTEEIKAAISKLEKHIFNFVDGIHTDFQKAIIQ